MLVDTLRGATTVPSSAVQRGVQGVFVYVVGADNTVALRPIDAGPVEGDNTAVRSGIKPGELVVVDGTDRLRAGRKSSRLRARRLPRRPHGRPTAIHRPERKAARDGAKGRNEPVAAVHPAAGGDLAADGRHLPVRRHRLPAVAALGAARSGLPDDPGRHVLSGRESRRDDLVGHRAAGAPVRADAGAEADVLDQLGRRVGDHAAVQPRVEPRRRGAGSAGGDQRRREFPPRRPAGAAGLQQGEPGRHADPHARDHFGDAAAAAGAEPRRYAARAEDLAAHRRRAGHALGRPAAGGARAGESAGAGRQRPQPRGRAHRDRGGQREPGQGQLRRPGARLHHRRQRPTAVGRRIQSGHRRLPQRRADLPLGRRRCDRRGGEYPPRGVDE